jgi:intein-encoded DNA endonuclease-like protein
MRETKDWEIMTVTEHTLPWYKRILNRHKGDVEKRRIVDVSWLRHWTNRAYSEEVFNERMEEYFFDGNKVYDLPRIRLWFDSENCYTKYFKSNEEMSEWIGEHQLLYDFIKNNMEIWDYE